MKNRHSAFIACFLAASVAACAVLPYSVVTYLDVCASGFGAELAVESIVLRDSGGATILALEFRYASPPRLSTTPGDYWLNVSTGAGGATFHGAIDKVFGRGISDTVDAGSILLSNEQAAALSGADIVEVSYWIWVDVPDRGSGSALSGEQTVQLEAD